MNSSFKVNYEAQRETSGISSSISNHELLKNSEKLFSWTERNSIQTVQRVFRSSGGQKFFKRELLNKA